MHLFSNSFTLNESYKYKLQYLYIRSLTILWKIICLETLGSLSNDDDADAEDDA